jgi:hypothetical protein
VEPLAVRDEDGGGLADVGDEHARPDDVREAEPRLDERRLDDLERGPRLGAGVAGMPRAAVRARVRGPGDRAGVADDHRPAVAHGSFPRPAA